MPARHGVASAKPGGVRLARLGHVIEDERSQLGRRPRDGLLPR